MSLREPSDCSPGCFQPSKLAAAAALSSHYLLLPLRPHASPPHPKPEILPWPPTPVPLKSHPPHPKHSNPLTRTLMASCLACVMVCHIEFMSSQSTAMLLPPGTDLQQLSTQHEQVWCRGWALQGLELGVVWCGFKGAFRHSS